ncbi:MAG: hypothetical protein ACKOXT_05950 [Actinomycetota bacterium]
MLKRVDPRAGDPVLSKGISWALVGMGVAGLIFVIANSTQDWHSALDYVAPVGVLLVGFLSMGFKRKK